MFIPAVGLEVGLPFRANAAILECCFELSFQLYPVRFLVLSSGPDGIGICLEKSRQPQFACSMMTTFRVWIEASIDGLFKLGNPDGEILLLVVRGVLLHTNLVAVFNLRSLPVVGVFLAFIGCRDGALRKSSPLGTASYTRAT